MLSLPVLIASLSVVLTLEHIDELEISIHPEGNSQTKPIGSNVVLRCSANTPGSPANYESLNQRSPVIRWRGPDTEYITAIEGRVHVESTDVTSSVLLINFLDSIDAGRYSCEVEFDGQYRSREIELIVYEGITFANTSTYVEQKLGTDALLECSAFAESRPELSWRFSGQRVETDGVKYALVKGGSLRVKNVQLTDNGTYECRAELDSYGELAVRNVLLNVLHGPMFIERPHIDDVVVKGSRIELRCVANGNPAVKYEWIKEQKVTDSTKLKVTLPSTTENSYVIESVDIADEGRYICRVSNKFGSREASVDISMLVRPQLKHMPPERRTVEGGGVIVSCEATAGLPEPTVQWYRIGDDESEKQLTDGPQSTDEDVLVDRTHAASCRLIISNIRRSHAGSYTCMARNEIGVHNRTIQVIVEYQPTIADGTAETTYDVKQYGWPGQVRQFTCSASGLPIPTITWMRNSQPVASNEFYRITMAAGGGKANGVTSVTSTLQITIAMKQTWLYGSYTCIAKNNHGNPKKVFSLLEAVRPDAPSNIAVINETPTSVTISVGMTSSNTTNTATNGDNTSPPITSWLVEYQIQLSANDSEEDTKSVVIDSDGSRILTLSGLEPDQLYAVYLSAVNQVGYSDKTKIFVRTPRQQSTVNGQSSDRPLDSEGPFLGQIYALEITPAAAVDGNQQTAIYTGVIVGVMATLAITIAVTVGAIIRRRQRHVTTSDGWCKGGVVVCCQSEHRCQKDDSDKMQHAAAAAVVIRRSGFRLSRLMFWKRRRSNLSQTSAHANGWSASCDADQVATDAVNVEAATVDVRPSEMTKPSAAGGVDVKEFTPAAVAEALQKAGSSSNVKSARVNSPHLSECRRAPSTPPRTVFRSPSSTPGSPRLQRPGQLDSQAWKCLLPSSRTGSNSNTPTAAMPSSVLHQSTAVTSSNPFPERDWQLKKFLESPEQRQSFCSDDERAYQDILDGYHSEDNIEE